MKKSTLLGILFISGSAYSQTPLQQIDRLKEENQYLRNALHIAKPIKSVTASGIEFNLNEISGNIREQTITLALRLVNKNANDDFQFREAKAIDVEGNDYTTGNITIGSTGIRSQIYTNTPVKTTIKFKGILPSVKIFKLVDISYYDPTSLGKKLSFQFSDLNIDWK